MSVGFGVRGVVDANDFQLTVRATKPAAEEVTPNSSKSVDSDSNHVKFALRMFSSVHLKVN